MQPFFSMASNATIRAATLDVGQLENRSVGEEKSVSISKSQSPTQSDPTEDTSITTTRKNRQSLSALRKRRSFWEYFKPQNAASAAVPTPPQSERGSEDESVVSEDASEITLTVKDTSMKVADDKLEEAIPDSDAKEVVKPFAKKALRKSSGFFNFWQSTLNDNAEAKEDDKHKSVIGIVKPTNSRAETKAAPPALISITPRMPSKAKTCSNLEEVISAHQQRQHKDLRFVASATRVCQQSQNLDQLRDLATQVILAFDRQTQVIRHYNSHLDASNWRLQDLHEENTQLRQQLSHSNEALAEKHEQVQKLQSIVSELDASKSANQTTDHGEYLDANSQLLSPMTGALRSTTSVLFSANAESKSAELSQNAL